MKRSIIGLTMKNVLAGCVKIIININIDNDHI